MIGGHATRNGPGSGSTLFFPQNRANDPTPALSERVIVADHVHDPARGRPVSTGIGSPGETHATVRGQSRPAFAASPLLRRPLRAHPVQNRVQERDEAQCQEGGEHEP